MKTECRETQIREVIVLPAEYKHEVIQVTEERKWGLMARVRPLHEKLGFEPSRTEKEVYYNLRAGTEVSMIEKVGATPKEIEDVAFVAQNIVDDLDIKGREMRILSIAAKVVAPEYQRHQFGTFLAQEAILRHKPNAVTGRTQNPNALRAYEKTGLLEELFPIDRLYPDSIQIALAVVYGRLSYMLDRNVYEDDSVNLRTGLCKGVYPGGAGRFFIAEELSPAAKRIYDRMKEIAVEFENGDGIRYWALVDIKRLSQFPYSGPGIEQVVPEAV